MGNCALHETETLYGAARLSRKRDHEGKINNRRQTARQDRIGRDLHGLGAHDFTEAGYFDSHDGANRFRRDIAWADSGPASSQNQAAALLRK